MNILKAARLQCAADDIATLADMVADLNRLLDKIGEDHGAEISDKVNEAFPYAWEIGPKSNAGLLKLVRALTPPDGE